MSKTSEQKNEVSSKCYYDELSETKTLKFSLDNKNFLIKKSNDGLKSKSEKKDSKTKHDEQHIVRDGNILRIRQPFKILTDIWGVLTSYHFRNDLFNYIDANLENYLSEHLKDQEIKVYIDDLIKRTNEDCFRHPNMPIIVTNGNDEELIKSIAENLKFRRTNPDKKLILMLDGIFNKIWNEGYAKKTLRPHVFPDVIPNFRKWQSDPYFIKIYTFASGPLEIQKLFLSASIEGNVSEWITSGFDTQHRFKYDANKYRGVIASLGERDPKNLFYLTDSPKKGREAMKSGMTVFIVLRPGNRKYKENDLKQFYTINNLDELDFFEFGAPCC